MAVNEWCTDFMSFSSDGLAVVDAHKNIKYINPGALKALDELAAGRIAVTPGYFDGYVFFYQRGKLAECDCHMDMRFRPLVCSCKDQMLQT
jgi:hypothetical protein